MEQMMAGLTLSDGKKTLRYKLETKDGEILEIDEDIAKKSITLMDMITNLKISDADDRRLEQPLPVPDISGNTMKKILEWCIEHRSEEYKPKAANECPRIPLTHKDWKYMDIDNDELLDLLMAADYLNIQGIIDIVTQKIACMAYGRSVEEIREVYMLENDLEPEEEEEIRKKYEWFEV